MHIHISIVTGICECGCSWKDHHLSMIVNKDYWKELQKVAPSHPPYHPDECTKYGSNETGGQKYNPETEEWEDHCYIYRDIGLRSGT